MVCGKRCLEVMWEGNQDAGALHMARLLIPGMAFPTHRAALCASVSPSVPRGKIWGLGSVI